MDTMATGATWEGGQVGANDPPIFFTHSKGKAVPLQAWTGLEGSRFQDNRHMKVVRLSYLRTGHLYPPGNILGTHFFQRD